MSARHGVVTVTPAPAIDQTYRIRALRPGQLHRAAEATTELSGKGVNVARAIALSPVPVRAVLPLAPLGAAIAADPLLHPLLAIVEVPGRTRINTSVLDDATGATTKVNEAAVPLPASGWRALAARALDEARELDAEWLVISGTMPAIEFDDGATDAAVPFLELARAASHAGLRVAVDTAGASLATARADLAAIDLLKPNTHELAELVDRPLSTIGDVVAAARELVHEGCGTVAVSMGADGLLAVTADAVEHAIARATPVNTAGAGDAALAGLLVGGVGTAASWGAAAVASPTTLLTDLAGAPTAVVTPQPDPGIPLTDPATTPGG